MDDPDKTIPPPDDHAKISQEPDDVSLSNKETVPPGPDTNSNLQNKESFEIPRTFGRYQIKKVLGKGAMGSVYLAQDEQLDRLIAIKIPHANLKQGSRELERFYREAQSAGTLRHSNICPVYDVGEIDGYHYICMAYIEGRPLSDYINTGRRISQKKAASVIRKMALALELAHQQGIVHRDLKPENVIIDRNGEPIITDFGLAHQFEKDNPRLTQNGALLGSPGYMSPEQIENDTELIDPRSDVYSLGVLFFEFLAGRLPFEGTTAAVLGQIIAKEPPKLSEFRSDVYPELETICLKMIQKKPAERFQSMDETVNAITTFLKQTPVDIEIKNNTDTVTDSSTLTPPEVQVLLKPSEKKPSQKSVRMNQLPSWLITIGVILGLLITGLAIAVVSLFMRMNDDIDPDNSVAANVQSSLAKNKLSFWIDGQEVNLDQIPKLENGLHHVELKDSNGEIIDKKKLSVEEEGFVPVLKPVLLDGNLKIAPITDYALSPRGLIESFLKMGGQLKFQSDRSEEPVTIDSMKDLPAEEFKIISFDRSVITEADEEALENLKKAFPSVEVIHFED